MSRWFPMLSAAGIALLCAGCGARANPPGPSSYAMTHPVIVAHEGGHPDALYVPDPIRVHLGQVVTWTNKDTDPHDVTSSVGHFDSGPIAYRATYSWRPTKPGTYPYFCTIHPDMHGVIIVKK